MDNYREQERMVLNMKDAGCSEDTIQRFLLCYQADDIKGELKVLSNHRQALLDELHKGQKEIDCLDYLVYQIKKVSKQKNREADDGGDALEQVWVGLSGGVLQIA